MTRTRRLSAEEKAQDKRMRKLLKKPLGEFTTAEWHELNRLMLAAITRMFDVVSKPQPRTRGAKP